MVQDFVMRLCYIAAAFMLVIAAFRMMSNSGDEKKKVWEVADPMVKWLVALTLIVISIGLLAQFGAGAGPDTSLGQMGDTGNTFLQIVNESAKQELQKMRTPVAAPTPR